MLKNYLRLSITVFIQTLLPIMALFILAPLIINTKIINQWQQTSSNAGIGFIILHGLFYLTLILLWPKLINRLQNKNQISLPQFKTALNIRWYLLAIFLLIDALMLWRMI